MQHKYNLKLVWSGLQATKQYVQQCINTVNLKPDQELLCKTSGLTQMYLFSCNKLFFQYSMPPLQRVQWQYHGIRWEYSGTV